MRVKKIVTIILTLVVFFTAAFLGVSAVYRIEEVTLVLDHVSMPALEEAAALKESLEKAYLKRSTIGADDTSAKEEIAKFSYFRLTGFKKDYPGRLVITAKEDAEVYAVRRGDLYEICSASGAVLSLRESAKNRADGKDNLFVEGLSATENFSLSPAYAILKTLDEKFGGIRANVTEVRLVSPASDFYYLDVSFREGVKARIYTPDSRPEGKAEELYVYYAEKLTVAQRTKGAIYVPENGNASYSERSLDSTEQA